MLPKLVHTTVAAEIKSTGKTVRIRPMQAREEKVLLTAKEAGDDNEILTVVSQVVQNCIQDPMDLSKNPVFDAEWLFVQLRMASVSPVSDVSYIDRSDRKQYDFEVELGNIELVRPEAEQHFEVADGVQVQLRWPSVADYIAANQLGDADAVADELTLYSIDKIFQGDQVFDFQKAPREEQVEFVDSLNLDAYHKVLRFIDATPHLHYEIKYRNSKGEERSIVLRKLTDFFAFR